MQGQPGATARPTPNRRDLRKYARLFVKTDQDGDGFVSSDEAYSLFTKSQLPEHILQQVWVLSNVSGSGMLSFPEFIAAMHLIREARQTQQSPTAISGELSAFLGGVSESAQELSLEGNSRSARTLRSPVAFQGAGSSPHFGHALPAVPAESFGLHSPELPELPQTPFQPEPEEPATGEDGKKKKGRKKERKEKKETPGQDQVQPEVSEPWDSGQVGSAAQPDFRSAAGTPEGPAPLLAKKRLHFMIPLLRLPTGPLLETRRLLPKPARRRRRRKRGRRGKTETGDSNGTKTLRTTSRRGFSLKQAQLGRLPKTSGPNLCLRKVHL